MFLFSTLTTHSLGIPADIYLIDEPSAYLDSEQRIIASRVIKRFIMHSKKTAFIVEHDFIMATYLADRVIVFDGQPGLKTRANKPESLLTGCNKFLESLDVTFRRDPNSYRPRINKLDSQMDQEQKNAGQYVSDLAIRYSNATLTTTVLLGRRGLKVVTKGDFIKQRSLRRSRRSQRRRRRRHGFISGADRALDGADEEEDDDEDDLPARRRPIDMNSSQLDLRCARLGACLRDWACCFCWMTWAYVPE